MLSLFSKMPQILCTFKYRDRAGIMSDILMAISNSRNGKKKTQIMQSANLNYLQTTKYLDYMTNCGYIVATQDATYVLTDKGARYLQLGETQELRIR